MSHTFSLSVAHEAQFDALAALWEASVRATHDFLTEADIRRLREQVRHLYLAQVPLRVATDGHGKILGFIGVAGGHVEMLFVAPEARGKGVGRTLLQHAVSDMGATSVDVNEQNPQAVGFYAHQGFETVGRSALDGEGKPFPLLHMRLGQARRAAQDGEQGPAPAAGNAAINR